MDAVGITVGAVGMFLLYCAYKGEHPWTLFQNVIGADSTPAASPGTTVSKVDTGGNIQPVATAINPTQSAPGTPGINALGGSTASGGTADIPGGV